MRLTALVESPQHVCCRYRLSAFIPYLEQAGHTLTLRPWPRSCWSRLRIRKLLEDCDGVILQRKLLPNWLLYLLRSATKLLIFDFDDAIFLRDSYSRKGLHSARRLLAFSAMMEAADHVVAGNSYLVEQARKWAKPANVHLIPTCVEPSRYRVSLGNPSEALQLAWIGSSSTLQGLERMQPFLEKLGAHQPGLSLKIICDRFMTLQNMKTIHRPWAEESEADELATADVGISWLPADDWSRGKCGLKVLQYMAAGLPVVANPVGVHPEMIVPGKTGFLAESPDDWQHALHRLTTDPELRRQLGRAGRQKLEADFSVAVGASKWLDLLAGQSSGRQVA